MSLIKQVGLKEIAYELNVSINTVSRALRDCDDISESMKKKVRNKAIELGYFPNNVEEYVKKDLKKNIVFLGPAFTNSYFAIMCNEIYEIIDKDIYNYNVVISMNDPIQEEDIKRCILQRSDAIITFLEPTEEAASIAKLYNIPMLVVGRNVESDLVDQIYTDDKKGGRLAAEYLIERKKCRNLCFVTFPFVECSKRRYEGFSEFAKEHNMSVDIYNVENISKLDIDYFINKNYDGIFCFSDELAYALLYSASYADDVNSKFKNISIIGYDALAHRIRGLKRITSINSNFRDIARKAYQIIVARLDSDCDNKYEKICFPVSLYLKPNEVNTNN